MNGSESLWLYAYAVLVGLVTTVGVTVLATWEAYCYVHRPRTEYAEVEHR